MPDNQSGSVIKQTMFFSLVNGGYLVGATRESAYTRRRASVISATWQWTFLCMTPWHAPAWPRPTDHMHSTNAMHTTHAPLRNAYAILEISPKSMQRALNLYSPRNDRKTCKDREDPPEIIWLSAWWRCQKIWRWVYGLSKTRLVYWNKWNLVACLSKVTVEGWTLKFGKY